MNRIGIHRIAFVVAAATILAAGTPAHAADADDKIESAFKNSFVYRTYLKDDSIQTAVEDGAVTLTGTVNEDHHKGLAHETAASLPGVKRVDNQLTTRAEVAAASADNMIARKVKLGLLFNRHVSASSTEIEVNDGTVTLRGDAVSDAQKALTEEYAMDVEGVKGVKNEMKVMDSPPAADRTLGEKIDDASVTAHVKTALLSHRSTSAVTTKVESRDGTVTLTGIAKNEAEKSLVSKLVADIHGVSDVKNEMTVAEPKAL